MTSTSRKQIAEDLLSACLRGAPPAELPPELIDDPSGQALFGVFVEGLADRFEPELCGLYVRLFARAVARAAPGVDASALEARYRRVRGPRAVAGEPERVYVLSRITLGADVAVTSVLLAAAKRRFPGARIFFVGPAKNAELFAADSRVRHVPVTYRRGGLRDRLDVWDELKAALQGPGPSLVVDPDSRLTQLGLLPVCAEQDYRFFESRAYGADSALSLPELAAAWCAETFGVTGARPYVALNGAPPVSGGVAVSLGVGENPAKRVPDPFERELLALLAGTGMPLCVDAGAGGEEAERVGRAIAGLGAEATTWTGSFAGFAAIVAASRLYAGYDSAGQHVASACGVPLVSVFAGFPVPRMFDRWRPTGPGAHVVRVDRPDPDAVLSRVRQALEAAIA